MKIYTLIIIPLFIFLAACSNQPPEPEEVEAIEMTDVALQLSWVHEYSSSMFHSAVKEGYFAEHGINVTLNQGGFGENGFIDPIAQVVEGGAEFGFADAFEIVQARNEGLPVVGLASVLQRSPSAIMSLESQGIQRPQDLEGHSITIAEGGAMMLFDTLLDAQNVDSDAVTVTPRLVFGVDPVLNGEVDSLLAWITNEGVALEEAGETPDYIMLSDYGIDSYNFVLFTTDDMIAENPELVQGVVTSIQEGIEFVVSNPEDAIKHTLEYAPDLDEEAQLRRLQASIPLMNVPNVEFGSMDAEVWHFITGLLHEQGLIEDDFDETSVYTLDFINADND